VIVARTYMNSVLEGENLQMILKLGEEMGVQQKDCRRVIRPLRFLFFRFLPTLTKDPRVF
jgi:hypothetical protein